VPAGVDPSSPKGQTLWMEHLWACVMADPRFATLVAYWGMDTVADAIGRDGKFREAWAYRVLMPMHEAHKQAQQTGNPEPKTDTEMQQIAREHATLRRMFALEFGLTEELPGFDTASQ
jgi:hypothetical protein